MVGGKVAVEFPFSHDVLGHGSPSGVGIPSRATGEQARLIGITEDGIAKPLPQSFGGTQFFDIGTAEPYSISGEAVRQRDKLIEVIQQKEKDTDYKTAYQYVTEGTFDAYLYQTLENKQKFISQIMTSKSPVRSCDAVSYTHLDVYKRQLLYNHLILTEKLYPHLWEIQETATARMEQMMADLLKGRG